MEISDSTINKYCKYLLYIGLAFGGEEIVRHESRLEDENIHLKQELEKLEERVLYLERK